MAENSPPTRTERDQHDEVVELAVRYLDGGATEQERRRLAKALRSKPEARAAFVHLCNDVVLLRDVMAARRAGKAVAHRLEDAIDQADVTPASPNGSLRSTPPVSGARQRSLRLWATPRTALALAASIVMLITASLLIIRGSENAPDARLVAQVGALWHGDQLERGLGISAATGGPLELDSGIVEIDMRSGARVTIEGPATFEVTGPNSIELGDGKIYAHIPDRAHGFTVRTGNVEVVDLGTAFGVERIDNQNAEVYVYEGEVEVHARPAGGRLERSLALTSGEAVSFTPAGMTTSTFDPASHAARERFAPRAVRILSLSDMVAGGDGTGDRRARGIDPITGAFVSPADIDHHAIKGDSHFAPVADSPFIDGVFIPAQDRSSAIIDSVGSRFTHYRMNQRFDGGKTFGPVWSGQAPVSAKPRLAGENRMRSDIGEVDYAAPGRSLVFIHANKGITYDIEAIENAHPGWQLTRLTGIVANTEPTSVSRAGEEQSLRFSADVWVLIDGEIAFTAFDLRRQTGAVELDIDIPLGAKRLTLIATSGMNAITTDWVMLGDPAFELLSNQR